MCDFIEETPNFSFLFMGSIRSLEKLRSCKKKTFVPAERIVASKHAKWNFNDNQVKATLRELSIVCRI